MQNSLVNLIDDLNTTDFESAWSAAAGFFADYGFHITNYAKMSSEDGNILGFFSNMTDNWMNHYMAEGYYLDDAYGAHAFHNPEPIIYSRDGHSELHIDEKSISKRMFDDVAECGLVNSLCIPIHNSFGGKVTGFNLGTELSYDEFSKIIEGSRHEILLAAALVNNTLIDAPTSAETFPSWYIRPDLVAPLTLREVEVLQWLSEGHRNIRIAEKMDIAPVTVNFHLSEIKRKLGAKTREQAVAIAFKLGLLR